MLKRNKRPLEEALKQVAKENNFQYVEPSQRKPAIIGYIENNENPDHTKIRLCKVKGLKNNESHALRLRPIRGISIRNQSSFTIIRAKGSHNSRIQSKAAAYRYIKQVKED